MGWAIPLPAFVVSHPLGFLVMDDEGQVLREFSFPSDPKVAAERHFEIRRVQAIEEIKSLAKYLKSNKSIDLVVLDSQGLKSMLGDVGRRVTVDPTNEVAILVRRRSRHYAEGLGWRGNEREYHNFLRELGTELTRKLARLELERGDYLVIKAIDYLDHLNKSLSMLIPAIREWYSLHFPELNHMLEDHYAYVKIVSEFPKRAEISLDRLREIGISKNLAGKIEKAASESMGADLGDADIQMLKDVAQRWMKLYEIRRRVEDYMTGRVQRLAPNLSSVVQPLVAARLMAMAGGLKKLALMPSSTIQILGARRAIFLHMTRGIKPPKHGILFQMKEVRSAPKKLRGKIARIISAKAAIGARIDAFKGEYIGDKLKEEATRQIADAMGGGNA